MSMSTSASPPRKRPRSETLTDSDDELLLQVGRYTSESIQAYLTSLREVSTGLEAFTDASRCVSLLFPSLLRSSIPSLAPTGQYTFSNMGRSIFSTILSEVQRLDRQVSYPVVLLGTYGAGKSHLLSALASFLFTQGKRVVFMPESSLVADDPIFWFKLAFALPFADHPQTMQKIVRFKTTDDFIEFARGCREDIYFLVDDFDRLERDLRDIISALASSHFFIHTTCALDTPATRGSAPVRIPSGLAPSEIAQWMRHFESQLPLSMSEQHTAFIEDFTGGVPSLLQALFEFRGENFGDVLQPFRTSQQFQNLEDNVTAFNTTTLETLTKPQKTRYLQLMSACLTETIPEIRPGSNTALFDPRYFYFDGDGRGKCICRFAEEVMIPLLRLEDLNLFTSDAWYSSVRCGSTRTRDSAMAQICLTRIGTGGLTQADALGNAMRICTFRQDPIFGWMFEEAWKSPRGMSSFLCIPGSGVCKFLSAVILRINPSDRTAHLIPLQITTAQTCADIATQFFAITWHRWERAIEEEGFKVINTFVCVDSCTPGIAEISAQATAFREKVKFVSPEYTVRNLSVGLLDPKLGRILEGDKYQSPPV